MDKLKRVLSGRDAEEPSGLAEVTNARLPPAPASLPEPGRRRGAGLRAGAGAAVAERR